MFKPNFDEDYIYKLAMAAYDDENIARQRVKTFAHERANRPQPKQRKA